MPKTSIQNIPLYKLRAYIDGKTEYLSPIEQAQLDRLYFAYDQLKTESIWNAAKRIQRRFDVSISQAHRDVHDCKKLFNPTNKHDIDWIENFLIEDIKLQMNVAKAEQNHTAWANARTHLLRMYAIMSKKELGIDPEILGNNSYFAVAIANNQIIKLNLDEVFKLPENERLELSSSILYSEIDAETAKKMMDE